MIDWENLRHFLAVARTGTLSGAARSLQVDHATVSRRLAALETALQVALVERLPRSCRLTPMGMQIHEYAKAMETSAFAVERLAHGSREPLAGKVTLSAPPVLVTHLLAARLVDFRARYPGIQLAVSAQAQQVSLSRREADVALRLVRPKEASNVVRQIGQMPFALYASPTYVAAHRPEDWTFIAYDAQFADMPQQQWLLGAAGNRVIGCELSDIGSHLMAARAGVGVAGLPCFLGDEDAGLVRLEHQGRRSHVISGWWCTVTCVALRLYARSWTLWPTLWRRSQGPAWKHWLERRCLVFVVALVAVLLNAETAKGEPLTEAQVLDVRDRAACITLPASIALVIEDERGYRDIVAEDCWEEWQRYRRETPA